MNKYILHNSELLREDMFAADEVFLTNNIQGLKRIESFEEKIPNSQNCKLGI